MTYLPPNMGIEMKTIKFRSKYGIRKDVDEIQPPTMGYMGTNRELNLTSKNGGLAGFNEIIMGFNGNQRNNNWIQSVRTGEECLT